jgi:hypothetical protein
MACLGISLDGRGIHVNTIRQQQQFLNSQQSRPYRWSGSWRQRRAGRKFSHDISSPRTSTSPVRSQASVAIPVTPIFQINRLTGPNGWQEAPAVPQTDGSQDLSPAAPPIISRHHFMAIGPTQNARLASSRLERVTSIVVSPSLSPTRHRTRPSRDVCFTIPSVHTLP